MQIEPMYKSLHKEFCEIEGCEVIDADQLHHHHIIERTELGTSNNPFNIAVICANHHELAHSGRLKIIGVYPSTAKHGRMLIYELDGIPNVPGITEPYFKNKPKQSKVYLNEK
jgi:hypothetical protein